MSPCSVTQSTFPCETGPQTVPQHVLRFFLVFCSSAPCCTFVPCCAVLPLFCPLFCSSAPYSAVMPPLSSSVPCSPVLPLVLQFCPLCKEARTQHWAQAPTPHLQKISGAPHGVPHTNNKQKLTRIKDSQINIKYQLMDRTDIK